MRHLADPKPLVYRGWPAVVKENGDTKIRLVLFTVARTTCL